MTYRTSVIALVVQCTVFGIDMHHHVYYMPFLCHTVVQEVKVPPCSESNDVRGEGKSPPGWTPSNPPTHIQMPLQFVPNTDVPLAQIVHLPQGVAVNTGVPASMYNTGPVPVPPSTLPSDAIIPPDSHANADVVLEKTNHSPIAENIQNSHVVTSDEPLSETSSSLGVPKGNTVVHRSDENNDDDKIEDHVLGVSSNGRSEVSPVAERPPDDDSTSPNPSKLFLPGPDVKLPAIDLEELIKSHDQIFQPPSTMSTPSPKGLDLSQIILSGKLSLGQLIEWIRSIATFTQLPRKERVNCLKYCWLDQIIYSTIFRTFIRSQSGNVVLQLGMEVKPSDVSNSLVAYGVNRIMIELLGTFKSLNLDYKEFVCIRLLALFNPGTYVNGAKCMIAPTVCVCVCVCVYTGP